VTRRGVFVTGTDTGVGKTRVACALLRGCVARGERAVGMKPVAAGAEMRGGRLWNEDVALLRAASNSQAPQRLVNPYCFAPPIAPHLAAREAGVEIRIETIVEAFGALAARADWVVVEGAGGLLVPLSENCDMGQVACALALPVVLVVGMRLGCLNHALLTVRAIRELGLTLAGWVANCIDPDAARLQQNIGSLRNRIPAPLLAQIAFDPTHAASRLIIELPRQLN